MWPSKTCLLLALVCLLVACSDDDDSEQVSNDASATTRTILAYIAAENSLSSAAVSDVNEMLAAASNLSAGDHLIVYIDNIQLPRIYNITYTTQASSLSALTPVVSYDEELDSADPDVLADIICWTINNYPADSYGLILWSHASGWLPASSASSSPRRTFAIDNSSNTTSNTGSEIELSDLATVLAPYQWEFILFDACFMQSMEVACELEGCTHYLIASPAEIPENGAPYTTLLPLLFTDTFDAEAVVDAYVADYADSYGCLLSAIDCTYFEDFSTITEQLLETHAEELLAADLDGVLNYFDYDRYASRLAIPDAYDLKGVLLLATEEDEQTAWQQLLDQALYTVYSPTWYSAYPAKTLSVDEEQYSGISLFLPLEKYQSKHPEFLTAYAQTTWGKRMTW